MPGTTHFDAPGIIVPITPADPTAGADPGKDRKIPSGVISGRLLHSTYTAGQPMVLTLEVTIQNAVLYDNPGGFDIDADAFKKQAYFPLDSTIKGQLSFGNLDNTLNQVKGQPLQLSLSIAAIAGKIGGAGL